MGYIIQVNAALDKVDDHTHGHRERGSESEVGREGFVTRKGMRNQAFFSQTWKFVAFFVTGLIFACISVQLKGDCQVNYNKHS